MTRAVVRFAAIVCAATLGACSWLFGLEPDEYANPRNDAGPGVTSDASVGDERTTSTDGDAGRGLHLYVLGGSVPLGGSLQNTVPTDKVYFAPISDDGSVGAFRETTRLPVPVRSHAAVAHGEHIYVLGGETNQEPQSDAVYAAHVRADGELDAWVATGTRLAGARKLHAVALLGNRVYVAGGLGAAGHYFGDVLSAELSNGTTGPFSEVAQLDAPAFALAAAARGDRLYVLGGVAEDATTRATTLSFKVLADGGVSSAQAEQPLLDGGACYHGAGVVRDSVISVGAVKNGIKTVTGEVAESALDPDGRTSEFQPSTPLPVALWSHAVAVARDRVYVTGGLGPNANPRYDHVLIGAGPEPFVWKESETRLPQSMAAHASVIH